METASRLCPDPEILAAFFDQGLGADENQRVEAHLAGCDRCRVIVARVLDTQSAVQEAGPVAPVLPSGNLPARDARFTRAQIAWGAGSLLAAAAVLAVMVNVGTGSRLADLAAAVGDERPIEARLTGGFRYGPLRPPVRSGGSSAASDDWTLYAAAGRIREDADRDPSARNLHALGVAYLVLGQYDEAVRALEDAIAEDADQAQYHSDLSAAYLARAKALERPDDLPRALGAAERAVKLSDGLLEARFNRALALEALFLNDQARQAWEEYIARDRSSGWASDARAHLQKVQQSVAPQDGARNNSPPPIDDTSVEAAFDWLLRSGLPLWADAVMANDADRAAREHLAFSDYAQQISTHSGDDISLAFIRLLESSADPKRDFDRVRHLAIALQRFDADDMAGMEATLIPLCNRPAAPIEVLCAFHLGAVDVLERNEDSAARRAARLRELADQSNWKYASMLAERLSGYQALFRGSYATVAPRYTAAFNQALASKFFNSAANLASQLADVSDVVGLPLEGWRWRMLSLQYCAQSGSKNTVYLTRLQTAGALVAQHNAYAAAAVISAIEPAVADQLPDLKRAFLEMTRARIAVAIGEPAPAHISLQRVHDVLAQSQDFRARRLLPDVLTTQAAVQIASHRFDEARTTLTAALSKMGPERAFYRATTHLARANLSGSASPSSDVERDIASAIDLLRQRAAGASQPVRFDDAADALEAVATLAGIHPTLQGLRGVYLAERVRQLLNGVSPEKEFASESELEAAMKGLTTNDLVISFLLSSDSLRAWVISANGVQYVARPTPLAEISRTINSLTVQVNRNPASEHLWRPALVALYDMLLRDIPGLNEATDLTIVPDGILARVPFGALVDASSSSYLFERASVRIAPALAFAFGAQSAREDTVPLSAVAVGDPYLVGPGANAFQRLTYARTEAFHVAGFYKRSDVVLGEQATKARVLEAISSADVVHYAGHAIVPPGSREPRLLLAGAVSDPAPALTASDLRGNVRKQIRIVLAACETAASLPERASGLTNLSTAFLRAGAGSVVANLWEVGDRGSELFFSVVHRELSEGRPPAKAVAAAQRVCRQQEVCRRDARVWIGTTVYGSQ